VEAMNSQIEPHDVDVLSVIERQPCSDALDVLSSGCCARAKTLAKRAVAGTACGMCQLFGVRARLTSGILMYHRIADRVAGVAPPTMNVTPDAFRRQMTGLLDRGFKPRRLRQLIEEGARGIATESKTFVVTFDDGFEGVYRYAWPILKELKVPATVFLPTAYLDSPHAFPFDDWTAAGTEMVPTDTWRPLTRQQCLAMMEDDRLELGAHSHTHNDNSDCPLEFERDLALNSEALRSQLGIENPSFAFPYGRATSEMMKVVRDSGFVCALTTFGAPVNPGSSPFGWGRYDVQSWDTGGTLAGKLGGWYHWAPQLQRVLMGWNQQRRPSRE
jgi:peptidoglycan/xylan/chitin deacetylase (PgdA/CDA1 family)